MDLLRKRFNALLRASSFSTQKFSRHDKQDTVSMPYFGLLPFLRWQKWRELCQISMFQCPTSGFFLFYSKYAGSGACKQICFNALLRASSFSTVTKKDGTVVYSGVSMPYFGLLPFLLKALVNSG